ncbi:MAG TPA: hypothetical protein VHB99_08680 [Pirellulales bacterium]|nr:hypothetical protein [Pirellulales bacterium]
MTQEPDRNDHCAKPSVEFIGAALGDEAGATDEAWEALEQLLVAAQTDFDAAIGNGSGLVDQVLNRVSRRPTSARKRMLAAAALLVCCGAAWIAASRTRELAAPAAARAWVADAAWDDRLDVELAWMHSRAFEMETQWRRSADEAVFVRQQMDALEAEFDGDSL